MTIAVYHKEIVEPHPAKPSNQHEKDLNRFGILEDVRMIVALAMCCMTGNWVILVVVLLHLFLFFL